METKLEHIENSSLSLTNERNDVKSNSGLRRKQNPQKTPNCHAPMSGPAKPMTKGVKISAHRLRWTWKVNGTTERKPDRLIKMRNWNRKVYEFNGATVILNTKTLEIYMQSRAYKDPQKMIYANWDKADRIARAFAKFAWIGLKAIESDHPADCQDAHLVLETKELNPYLKPQAEQPSSQRVGLVFDKSHNNKPEFTGPESIEGGIGADYIFLDFPREFRKTSKSARNIEVLMGGFAEYNRNIQLHLKVLQKMSDTLDKIAKIKTGDSN